MKSQDMSHKSYVPILKSYWHCKTKDTCVGAVHAYYAEKDFEYSDCIPRQTR